MLRSFLLQSPLLSRPKIISVPFNDLLPVIQRTILVELRLVPRKEIAAAGRLGGGRHDEGEAHGRRDEDELHGERWVPGL